MKKKKPSSTSSTSKKEKKRNWKHEKIYLSHIERKSIFDWKIQAKLLNCSQFLHRLCLKKKKSEPSWPAAALRLCSSARKSHTMHSSRAVSEPLSSFSHTQQHDRDSESHYWPTPLPRHSDLSLCLHRFAPLKAVNAAQHRHKQKLSNN